jgi:hypothetical protein
VATLMQQCYDLYVQSQKNLRSECPDLSDQVIVTLWELARDRNEENIRLKKELDEAQKDRAEYYRRVDLLEAKLLKLTTGTTEVNDIVLQA